MIWQFCMSIICFAGKCDHLAFFEDDNTKSLIRIISLNIKFKIMVRIVHYEHVLSSYNVDLFEGFLVVHNYSQFFIFI
jgi:hypothetical protein